MNPQGNEADDKIVMRPVKPETVSAELRLQLEEVQQTVARLEQAKIVSQETLQLEVSV